MGKACFQHNIAYGDFKDLNGRTSVDKLLHDKAFYIAKNQKYDGYQCGLASMVYKVFDKGTTSLVDKSTSSGTVKNKIISDKKLAEELHKWVIRKFNKTKVHSPFVDNFWGADLADMQLISKFNIGFRFLLCVIYIYRKYVWVIPLIDKKGVTITTAICKPNKIWLDRGSEFYNWSMKSFYRTLI